jgi:hypothetical protein
MAFFDVPATQPTPPTLAETVKRVKFKSKGLHTKMNDLHAEIFRDVWHNPNFTPAQIIGEFGTNAKLLFEVSSLIQTCLARTDEKYQPLTPTSPVTLNDDGTVTLG